MFKYCHNVFYHDVDDFKKAIILWSVVYWGQYTVCRTNDNTFILNRMLRYDTALYDDIDDKWNFDRVNNLSATCYIKYSKNHYTYTQSLENHKEDNCLNTEQDECIVSRSNMYSSP